MLPKGKLFALVMIFAAIGLITASGAFTTVQADRQADLTVTGDSAALLQLEPHSSTDLATDNPDELTINLSSGSLASGLNTNATTAEDRLINITNQGDNAVAISVEAETKNGDAYFYVLNESGAINGAASGDVANDSSDFPGALDNDRYNISGGNSASRVSVGSGDTVTVGMLVNTTGLDTSSNDAIFAGDDAITVTAIDTNQTSSVDLNSNGTGLGPQQ